MGAAFLQALSANYGPIMAFMGAAIYLFAFLSGVMGVIHLHRHWKDHGRTAVSMGLWGLVFAVLLINLPAAIKATSISMYGQQVSSTAYFGAPVGGAGRLVPLRQFMQFLGYCFFLWGIVQWRRIGMGNARNGETVWSGGWRVIAGTMLINIMLTLQIAGTWFMIPVAQQALTLMR